MEQIGRRCFPTAPFQPTTAPTGRRKCSFIFRIHYNTHKFVDKTGKHGKKVVEIHLIEKERRQDKTASILSLTLLRLARSRQRLRTNAENGQEPL